MFCLKVSELSGALKSEGRENTLLFFPIEARKVLLVQCQQQKIINLKVFHPSIKKILSLFPVFQFFNAATEIPHGRVVSSNKNQPVKSPFPNEMGLSIKIFSKGTVTDSLSYYNCCFILVCQKSCYTKSWKLGGFNMQLVSLWLE